MNSKYSQYYNKTIVEASFVMFPEVGEEFIENIDLSLSISFEDSGITIGTGPDSQTPIIESKFRRPKFKFHQLKERFGYWSSKSGNQDNLDYEGFDLRNTDEFGWIIGDKIIEVIEIIEDGCPVGLKLIFESGNYVISKSHDWGNMIISDRFKIENII